MCRYELVINFPQCLLRRTIISLKSIPNKSLCCILCWIWFQKYIFCWPMNRLLSWKFNKQFQITSTYDRYYRNRPPTWVSNYLRLKIQFPCSVHGINKTIVWCCDQNRLFVRRYSYPFHAYVDLFSLIWTSNVVHAYRATQANVSVRA